jgi:hypothetical protein
MNFFHVSDIIGNIANPWTRGERAVMKRLTKTQQLFFCSETSMLALHYERGASKPHIQVFYLALALSFHNKQKKKSSKYTPDRAGQESLPMM